MPVKYNKKKIFPVIDYIQQHRERNISFRDFPMKNFYTDRPLKFLFRHYYRNYASYLDAIIARNIDEEEHSSKSLLEREGYYGQLVELMDK